MSIFMRSSNAPVLVLHEQIGHGLKAPLQAAVDIEVVELVFLGATSKNESQPGCPAGKMVFDDGVHIVRREINFHVEFLVAQAYP